MNADQMKRDLEDELASRKPKRSSSNPIPERVSQHREECIRRAQEEKEKDFYANRKPKSTGNVHRNQSNPDGTDDWFDTIYESTVSSPPALEARFPVIPTDAIYLQAGEKCYFQGMVQLVERKQQKEYVHESIGYATSGLFKGSRAGSGVSWSREIGEHTEMRTYSGMLYVTNKRTIFVEVNKGFDKRHTSISAINRYSDSLEIQYGSRTYLIVTSESDRLYELYELLH